jgi:hypothetical protein
MFIEWLPRTAENKSFEQKEKWLESGHERPRGFANNDVKRFIYKY